MSNLKFSVRSIAPLLAISISIFFCSPSARAQLNESFEAGTLPSTWNLSGGATSEAGPTGGVSASVTNLAATEGTHFAWITTGCQSDGANNPSGCNTLASMPTSYGFIYQGPGTNGLPSGQALGTPTVATTLQSPVFTLGQGDTISFDVNFLTNDGSYGFSDFILVQLVPTDDSHPPIPVTVANTTCATCAAFKPVGLLPGVGVINPATASFTGQYVTLSGINYGGSVEKYQGGLGGPTGWVHVSFSAPADSYSLVFKISHVGDKNYVSALAIDHIVTQTAPPQPVTSGTTNQVQFVAAADNLVQHNLTWPSTLIGGVSNPQLLSKNIAVSNSRDLPGFLKFTPWATGALFVKAGDNQLGNGRDFGSIYDDKCFSQGNDPSTASDQNCPAGTDSDPIQFADIFDQVDSQKATIAPGTTVSLLHFAPTQDEDWVGLASGATSNPACQQVATVGSTFNCDLSDDLIYDPAGPIPGGVFGDQTTVSGTKKLKGKFASLYNVPMLQTAVKVNGNAVNTIHPETQGNTLYWVNSRTINLDFLVSPAAAPASPTNGWVAAPVNTLAYILFNNLSSEPALPNPANCSATTAPGCSVVSGTPGQAPAAAVEFVSSPAVGADGLYTLAWSARDTVNIGERNIQLLTAGSVPCPNPTGLSPVPTYPCYSTTLFSAQIGVDSTKPTVTGLALSNSNPLPGQTVTASYTCADPPNNIQSGLASCGKNLNLAGVAGSQALSESFVVPSGNGPKTYAVPATDVAGNTFTATVNYFEGYQFSGFFAPVSNPGGGAMPVINVIKGGQTIPIKWQVFNGNGVGVTGLTLAPGGTVSLSAVTSPVCANDLLDNTIPVSAAGNSGLQDLGGGNYQYNWKTALAKGACVQLSVNPGDGTQHIAYFQAK